MIIYWSPFIHSDQCVGELDFFEPIKISSALKDRYEDYKSDTTMFKKCPAFRQALQQVFGLKFTHSIKIKKEKDMIFIDRSQEFFDQMFIVRSTDAKLLSFKIFYLLIAEKDLEVKVTSPYMEENDFSSKAIILPGQFNVGKWVRPMETPFLIKDGTEEISIRRGDIYAYLEFATDEKIQFKRFHVTDEMREKIESCLKFKKNYKWVSLVPFYNAFAKAKLKNWFLKRVRAELVE